MQKIILGEKNLDETKKQKGWAFYLGWAMVILPAAFSLEYWEVRTINGFVVECRAIDIWTLGFGVIALILAITHYRDWRIWSYALGAAALSMVGVGLNVGDVLCPDYVPTGPASTMPPFF